MPSRSFHTIETDVAAGHVLNKGCFPKTPPGLTQRASQGSAGILCHPYSEHFLAKLRGGERPRPRGPQNGGGAGCAWLIFKRVMSWSRGGGGPQKAAQSLTLRTRVHDFVWKNIFTDRVKFRVWRRGCPGLRVARIRCPASLQEKRGGVPCTDPQGVATRTQQQRPEWHGRSQGEPRATRCSKGRKDRKDPPKSFLVVLSHRVCGLLQQEEQAEGKKKKNHSSRTGGGRNGQELSPGMLAPVCTLEKGAWGWEVEDAQGRTF